MSLEPPLGDGRRQECWESVRIASDCGAAAVTPAVFTRAAHEECMAALIEAIEIKRKMFFEYEGAPYHCLDVEVSKPTARGGQTLVRLKMRNLLTRAVFDKTFKAGEKFAEPDLVKVSASYQYSDGDGYHFMDRGDLRDADAQRRTCSATIACCSPTTSSCRSRSTTATRSACSSRRTWS